MNDNFSDQLKNLPEVQFPDDLHGRIMRAIYYRKLRVPLFVIGVVLLGNAISIGTRLFIHINDLDGLSVLSAAWEGFEWSAYFFGNLWEAILTVLPLGTVVSFIVNLGVTSYIFLLWYKTSDNTKVGYIHHK